MSRDIEYIVDILESARLARAYVGDSTLEEFQADVQCQDSVIRRFQVIGEAAKRVSEEGRAAWPNLPWKEMVGMRNVVIHGYDAVDLAVVWETVTNDLPKLIAALERRDPGA